MATAPPSSPHYEPKPRWWHCGALVEGRWITYGGIGADGGVADPPSLAAIFDQDKEEWTQMPTSGTPPSGVLSAACIAVGPLLYHIGGADRGGCYNTVHYLNTRNKRWLEIQPANPKEVPMKKYGMGGIAYGNTLVTVGGYGDLPTNHHPGVEYIPDPEREGKGWTNEVVYYDIEQNMWFRPTISGSPLPACRDCSLTRVDCHRAVLFGGFGKDIELIPPDIYILDMLHWTWTVIPASQTPNHPVARFSHSSVSIYDPDSGPTHPALLIMWGWSDGEILRDSWIFHLNQQQWRKVILPESLKGRVFHTSVIIHSSPKIRIISFGGLDTVPEDGDIDKAVSIAQTTIVELSCSGGNPAEWIVTDVIPSSQLGQGNRLPTHMQLTIEEEMRHLTVCERIMREKGKVDLNFALCLLNGPPRVGKSTFLSRITGRQLPHSHLISETTSTGVAERILQVIIKKASFTIAMAPQPGMNWRVITLSQEAAMMLKAILSSQPSSVLEQLESPVPPTSPSPTSEGLSSEAVSTTVAETNRQPIAVEPTVAGQSLMRFRFGRGKKSHRIPGYQVPLEIFQKALRSKEWASAEEFLKQSLNIYFTDVGGQPEFQEVLPAIIAGPSVFFIVFKLPDSLHQKYRVQYVESLSRKSITYESSFTVLESILQSLASIASTCSYISRSSSELEPIQPKVVLVGTHKDQTDAEHIKNLQADLKEALVGTEHYKKGIVRFASPDEPALTINNLSDDDRDACKIRHLVEDIASDSRFKVSVPAPWLALLLSFRLVEKSMISYEECHSMANDCGIHGDEELKEALWFLHNRLGVIRYFHQIPELSDIVILDPQVIFNKITSLITHTFTFDETRDAYASEEFERKGIVSCRIIDELSSRSDELLSGSKLIILLKHLCIIAPIYEEELQSPSHYLVTCVLSHAPILSKVGSTLGEGCTPASVAHPDPHIPPLCVLFRCGYCPKGIFGALIADVINFSNCTLQWRLIDDAMFRDQVSFRVGREHHIVQISFFSTFLEVHISSETDCAKSQQRDNAKQVCNNIRLDIEQSLISVSRTLHYGSGAGFYFGFHCPSCSESTPAECDKDDHDPLVMVCRKCKKSWDLKDSHRFWFGEILKLKKSTCLPPQSNESQTKVSDTSCTALEQGISLPATSMEYGDAEEYRPSIPASVSIAASSHQMGSMQSQATETTQSTPSSATAMPSGVPTMKLILKRGIIQSAAAKWRELADLLEIDPDVTRSIEVKTNGDPETACREVLVRWLRGEGAPPTWKELYEALETLKCYGTSRKIARKV